MAHDHDSKEKVVYVGDSRVPKRNKEYTPRDYSAYPGKSEAFVPNFLLKEWMVGAVVLVGFMVLVMSEAAPLGYPADPSNTSFIPMPDWYFLFLYQLLKYPYTSEHFKIVGTLILPTIAFGTLLLTPFLDVGKERRFYRRPVASSLMFLSVAAIIFLTVFSWQVYQEELEDRGIVPEHIEREAKIEAGKIEPGKSTGGGQKAVAIVAESDPAYDVYKKATCVACHGDTLKGVAAVGAPALRGIGDTLDEQQIFDIMNNGLGNMPAGQYQASIDQNGLTKEEMDSLVAWLAKQKTATE